MRSIRPRYDSHGGFSLRGLSRTEVEDIHLATLEVLRDVGVTCTHELAKEVFSGAGARVENVKIKLPAFIVEEAIRSAPAEFILRGRIAENDFLWGGNRIGFNNFGVATGVIDIDTGKLRPSTKKDLEEVTRLIDALEHVDLVGAAVTATEFSSNETAELHGCVAMLLNTSKPIKGSGPKFTLAKIAEIVNIILDGKESVQDRAFFFPTTCPVSPLRYIDECIDTISCAVEYGMPVSVLSMVLMGASSPIHLASALVMHNAEMLFGLTFAQLLKKGTPVTYGSSTASMDMRHGLASVGSPETTLLNAALPQLAQYYKLPHRMAGG